MPCSIRTRRSEAIVINIAAYLSLSIVGKLADLTKAFALVNRDGLFKILVEIACPLTLIIASTSPFMMTRRKLVFAGSISEVLDI